MAGRKLGRGLDMLIRKREADSDLEGGTRLPPVADAEQEPSAPTTEPVAEPEPEPEPEAQAEDDPVLRVVAVDPASVDANPEQPRKVFERGELDNLKASIGRDGLLQPILVRRLGTGRLQLVAGERRLRAAQELELEEIPAIVAEVTDDRLLEVALIENIQRQDLNPIETAAAYRNLMRAKRWTQEELARALGVGRPSVSNTLRLLDLPAEMQKALAAGHINMGHAKVLLAVEDDEDRRELFERIAEERLSVRQLEDAREEAMAARSDGESGGRPERPRRRRDPKIAALEEELRASLGTKVVIQEGARKGRGRVTIEFYSADDFERIRTRLLARS